MVGGLPVVDAERQARCGSLMSGLHLAADRLAWQRSDDATCCGTQDDTTHDQRTRSTDSVATAGLESGRRHGRAAPRLKAVAPGLLPPCFILGAGNDSWCLADSLALAQALTAAASPYELHVMEGLPHGFMQMSALEGCRAAMRLMWDFLARNV